MQVPIYSILSPIWLPPKKFWLCRRISFFIHRSWLLVLLCLEKIILISSLKCTVAVCSPLVQRVLGFLSAPELLQFSSACSWSHLVFTIFESMPSAGLGSPCGSRLPAGLCTNLRTVRLSVAMFRFPFSLPSFARPVCISHRERQSCLQLFILLSVSSMPAGLGFLLAGLGSTHRIFVSPVRSPPSAVFVGVIWFPLADFFLGLHSASRVTLSVCSCLWLLLFKFVHVVIWIVAGGSRSCLEPPD
jgi:hypothetical protein